MLLQGVALVSQRPVSDNGSEVSLEGKYPESEILIVQLQSRAAEVFTPVGTSSRRGVACYLGAWVTLKKG